MATTRSLLLLAFAAALSAQAPTPAPVPPVDPTLPDLLKQLKSHVQDPKMTADFAAISIVQKLGTAPEARNPKDLDRITKALGDVFRTGKVRPADKDHLYRETADALAKLGADGAKELAKAFGDKRLDDRLPLRAHLLKALGRTEDEKQVELLTETAVRSPHDELRAAAGEALGNYTSLEIKARREVVKALVREWGSLHQKATTPDPTDPNAPIDYGPQNARKTLALCEAPWNATLGKLTGLSHTQHADWQRWLNKNPAWTPANGTGAPRKS